MLCRKDIEPRCAYCAHGALINEDEAVCSKKGVVSAVYHCRKFLYDPFSRVPPKLVNPEGMKITASELSLD